MGKPKGKRSPRGRLATRRGVTVTSIALPTPVHRRVAIAAAERGWVLTEIFRQAVAEWLARHEGRGGT